MQDEKILIDRNTLKAISSDTRFNILKLLNKRKYTLSELSEKLDLKKSTVTEHLKHLINADLIIKKEDKRKWKYYSLTEKGKNLLQPKAITVYLAFIVSLFASFSLITYFLYNFFNNSVNMIFSKPSASKAMATSSHILNNTTEGVRSSAATVTSKTVNVTSTNISSSVTLINKILIILIIIFVITTIVFFIIYLKKRKNYIKVI